MAGATPESKDLTVFILTRDSSCGECGDELGKGRWVKLAGERALCLACADLDHLALLPAGDAALTRRAKKASALTCVVLRWSRARKRYERQGLLVEEAALAQAEAECLEDADARARARERAEERRAGLDAAYARRFAARVRELFPACAAGESEEIAEHACTRSSGRIGRSAEAKALDEAAVRLAVVAHVRHRHTDYDALLNAGVLRDEARRRVQERVDEVLAAWASRP